MILFAHLERSADAVIRASAVQCRDDEVFASLDLTVRQENEIPPGFSRKTADANRFGVSTMMVSSILADMARTVRTVVMHGALMPVTWHRPGLSFIDTAKLSKPLCKLGNETDGYLTPTLEQAVMKLHSRDGLNGAESLRHLYAEICSFGMCEAA